MQDAYLACGSPVVEGMLGSHEGGIAEMQMVIVQRVLAGTQRSPRQNGRGLTAGGLMQAVDGVPIIGQAESNVVIGICETNCWIRHVGC